MWLINVLSRKLEYFVDERQQEYAILSHTWDKDEVTFQDVRSSEPHGKVSYQKIDYVCRQALEYGLRYAWIDTCCIDKTSSAELSEAINSMFSYYRCASICFVLLCDAPKMVSHCYRRDGSDISKHETTTIWVDSLKDCRWFRRGWTLQELLAPRTIHFYGPKWHFLGDKNVLLDALRIITGIDEAALDDFAASDKRNIFCVAKKMSWAAGRATTRLEDRAYSLLGLFNVNMPLIYGEGKRAFARLQEEIIRTSPDHSIFAWHRHLDADTGAGDLLATSPENFAQLSTLVAYHQKDALDHPQLRNQGLKIRARIVKNPKYGDDSRHCYAVLRCRYGDDFSGPLGLSLERHGEDNTVPVFYVSEMGTYGSTVHGRVVPVPFEFSEEGELKSCIILKNTSLFSNAHLNDYVDRARPPQVWIRVQDRSIDWSEECDAFPRGRWIGRDVFVPDSRTGADVDQIGCKIFREDVVPREEGEIFALAFAVTHRKNLIDLNSNWKDYSMKIAIGDPPESIRRNVGTAAARFEFARSLLDYSNWSHKTSTSWKGKKTIYAQAERAGSRCQSLRCLEAWHIMATKSCRHLVAAEQSSDNFV